MVRSRPDEEASRPVAQEKGGGDRETGVRASCPNGIRDAGSPPRVLAQGVSGFVTSLSANSLFENRGKPRMSPAIQDQRRASAKHFFLWDSRSENVDCQSESNQHGRRIHRRGNNPISRGLILATLLYWLVADRTILTYPSGTDAFCKRCRGWM